MFDTVQTSSASLSGTGKALLRGRAQRPSSWQGDTSLAHGASAARRRPPAAGGSRETREPGLPARDGRRKLRTLWLSDVHLGTSGCQAGFLLDFLDHHDAETIYLVGDIIDGWQLRKRWNWDPDQHRVLLRLIEAAERGANVFYVPGNHDEFARDFDGRAFAGIVVNQEMVHETLDGRRLLVVHGDQFDGIVQYARWLALLGDTAYVATLWLNKRFNAVRASLGLGYWSLSQYLKHKVKNAVSFITDFEVALIGEARRRGFDGVVCGHIHKAELREIDGLLYGNCGDWVESLTALTEDEKGRLELVTWDRKRTPEVSEDRRVEAVVS